MAEVQRKRLRLPVGQLLVWIPIDSKALGSAINWRATLANLSPEKKIPKQVRFCSRRIGSLIWLGGQGSFLHRCSLQTIVYNFLRTKVFVARRVARGVACKRSLETCSKKYRSCKSCDNSSQRVTKSRYRVNAIFGSRTARRWQEAWRWDESTKSSRGFEDCCHLLLPDPKKGGSSNLSRLRAEYTNVHWLPPAAEMVGQKRCQEVGLSLSRASSNS